jgi:geranylgeranyl pyrophosphate synthase
MAGRERHEQINRAIRKVKRSDAYETATEKAKEMVDQGTEKAKDLAERGVEQAKDLADRKTGDNDKTGGDESGSGTGPYLRVTPDS